MSPNTSGQSQFRKRAFGANITTLPDRAVPRARWHRAFINFAIIAGAIATCLMGTIAGHILAGEAFGFFVPAWVVVILIGAWVLLDRNRHVPSQAEVAARIIRRQKASERFDAFSAAIAGIYMGLGYVLGSILAIVVFIGAWGYCTVTYGFVLGFGLGWLPAVILTFIVYYVAYLWGPIAALALVFWLKQ